MKTLKYLIVLLFVMSCGTTKKLITKKDVEISAKTESIYSLQKKVDSLSAKIVQISAAKLTETVKIQWKYTAPTIRTDTLFLTQKPPVWLRIGKDSVNIADLPNGGTLEAGNTTEKTVEKLQQTISELNRKIENLKSKKSDKAETVYKDREVLKEIERTAYNWYLFAGVFALGIFTPELIRWLMKSNVYLRLLGKLKGK